ncbi:MAG: hypothetical protein HGA96_05860 [Desulfobulbaceae bacterium]|nr:hypothetical protein [Desulfobulbaceae bacterium]
MVKYLTIISHVVLLALFLYLQVQGASIIGSDEEKSQPRSQHTVSHK